MRQDYFFEYVPNAYINLCVDKAQQMANNRFVYDFKAGEKKAAHLCAEWLVRYLTKQYSSILEDFVVVFAPCSTQWKYNKRFGYLAAKQGGRCADTADSQGLSSHAPLLHGPCDSNRWSILQLSRQGQTIDTMGNVTGTRCPFSFLQTC